ncbi:MAG TPA: dephospho-CoA kinase [Micropepsaceae bacterium]|nr:dephospho-CoA kinase [Micropepsaceae bacterium]
MGRENRRPYLVGLTGSIGMGKTETGKLFAQLGIPVFDSDSVVRALYDPGGAAVARVAAAFPGTIHDGRVDRTALAAALERDPTAFARLEAIVHPLVRAARDEFVRAAAERGDELLVIDIPLLFETGAQDQLDATVVVSAPRKVQKRRVLARPGMTPEKLQLLHARQMPDEEKRAKADFVIETDKGLEQAFADVKRVAAELRARAKHRPPDA